jgi:Tol biopolymer transport system component
MRTRETGIDGRTRSALLLSLVLGAALAAVVALAGMARQAEAAFTEKVLFVSNRTMGKGVDNPTGENEIFRMNPEGTSVRQLTSNDVDEDESILSLDGQKIAYVSEGVQTSNPEGDSEVYVMNAVDGSGKKNLSNNGDGGDDFLPDWRG